MPSRTARAQIIPRGPRTPRIRISRMFRRARRRRRQAAPYAPDNGDTIQLLPQLTQPAPAQPQPVPTSPPPPSERRADDRARASRPARSVPRMLAGTGDAARLDSARTGRARKSVSGRRRLTVSATKRVGNQPFTLTFTETGVEPSEKIINPHGNVVPISTDGRAYASMRSRLYFDEYKTRGDGLSPTFAVDEITNLDCRIARRRHDGQRRRVRHARRRALVPRALARRLSSLRELLPRYRRLPLDAASPNDRACPKMSIPR